MDKTVTLKELMGEGDLSAKLKEISYENGVKLLEEVVDRVESGTLPLEKAILAYEKGEELVKHLRALLSGAEEKLRLLQRSGKEGKITEKIMTEES